LIDCLCPNCGIENKVNEKKCNTCNKEIKLNNQYYLIKILGENKSITYLARESRTEDISDIENSKKVIIKELSIFAIDNWKIKELFDREINILKSISTESIPKLIDSFELGKGSRKIFYIVMEYIDGENLEFESKKKIYNESEVIKIIEEIAITLDYLQKFRPPIIHRDIKPSNIMRKSDKSLALIDFGSVTDILKPKGGSTVVGTYGYMAPEQFMGKSSIKSDYYSLGTVALYLLTKKEIYEFDILTDDNFIEGVDISYGMKFILMKLITNNLEDRANNTNEIFELIKRYKNNDLNDENLLKNNTSTSLSDRIRKNSEIDKFEANNVKARYEKLDELLKTLEKKKTLNIFSAISYKKRFNVFLEKLKVLNEDIELIFLFIKNNNHRFRLNKIEILGYLKEHENKYVIDEGKIILYKKILEELERGASIE